MDRMGLAPWIRIRNTDLNKFKAQLARYLCTYDLYGPVRNAFDAGSIHYEGGGGGEGVSQGGFRAHTTPPVRLSNITALVRLSNITVLVRLSNIIALVRLSNIIALLSPHPHPSRTY
jgi:hypothetical protein